MPEPTEDAPRTYSIMWFLALFVLLVAIGGWAVIRFGTYDREPTEILDGESATTLPETTSTTVSVPVTMFDGSPAPEGIERMVGENGEYTYVFAVPEELRAEATEAVVPPVEVDVSDDGTSLRITFGCAVSSEAFPVALEVFEDPFEVNVRAVVVGPRFGTPCSAEDDAGTFNIPLESPVGSRRVVVARAGEPVNIAGFG